MPTSWNQGTSLREPRGAVACSQGVRGVAKSGQEQMVGLVELTADAAGERMEERRWRFFRPGRLVERLLRADSGGTEDRRPAFLATLGGCLLDPLNDGFDALTGLWIVAIMHEGMGAMKRITADVPEDLLREAMAVTNEGVSETLIAGLELVRRTRAYQKATALRGKLDLDIDLGVSRERERSHR